MWEPAQHNPMFSFSSSNWTDFRCVTAGGGGGLRSLRTLVEKNSKGVKISYLCNFYMILHACR